MRALISLLLFFYCINLEAQTAEKQKLYMAKVITVKDTLTVALFECTDSTITVVDMKLAKSNIDPPFHEITTIPISDLILIKIRRTGAIRRTAITLGIAGALTGAMVGLVGRPREEDYPYPGQNAIDTFSAGYYAIQGAVIGIAIGGTLGLAIGSGSKYFPINRNRDAYNTHQAQLSRYLYRPPQ